MKRRCKGHRDRTHESSTDVNIARNLFIITGITNNITTALKMYRTGERIATTHERRSCFAICPECGGVNLIIKYPCNESGGHEFCKDCNYQKFF